MIIRCKNCNEEYDDELFPVCPFCLTPKEVEGDETEKDAFGEDNSQGESISNTYNDEPIITSKDITDTAKSGSSDQELLLGTINQMLLGGLGDSPVVIGTSNSQSDESSNEMEDFHLSEVEELSTRARNVLLRNGIYKMSDLLSFIKHNEILELRNAGKKTVREINDLIERYKRSDYSIIPKNEYKDPTHISTIFSDNRFHLFVEYCTENDIVTIGDLEHFDFDELNAVRGLGKGKIEEIVSVCQKYLQEPSTTMDEEIVSDNQRNNIKNECLFEYINDQLRYLDISVLHGLGITNKQCDLLRVKGFNTIGSLEGIRVGRLGVIVGKQNLENFRNISPLLSLGLIELFESVLTNASNDQKFIVTVLKAEGYTLQDIGDLVGLTRERVRQVIAKYIHTLDPFMDPIVRHYMNAKGYVTVQELLDIYDNDDFDKIIIYWCKNSGHVNYLDYADYFLPESIDIIALEKELLSIAEDFVGDGIFLSEHIDDLADMIQEHARFELDTDSFVAFMQCHGYKLYGDYIVKGRQTYGALCAKIVGRKFPDGIKLYDEHDLNLLRQYTLEEFGEIGIPSDDRALSVRLTDYLVLRGRGTYIAEENIQVDNQLLDEIKAYIDERPEAEIYYSDLFANFEGIITMMSSIDNYNYLHGVLKLYFAEDYDFSNRDHLTKKGKGLISLKLSEKIRNQIIRAQRPIHKKEIKKSFPGITDIVLINAVASDDSLFQWDYNVYTSMDIIHITDEEKTSLRCTIDQIMNNNNGYCGANMLFEEVYRNQPIMMKKNNITDANNLFYLCSVLYSDRFDFRRPHICRIGLLEEMSIKSVALHMLGNPLELYYGDYQNLAEQFQWSSTTISIVFSDIERDYFKVSPDLYIRKDAMEIEEKALDAIRIWLKNRLKNEFVSLITIDFEGLPELQYEWNSHLMRSIIDCYLPEFKVIETRSKDRRYERGIVLDARSGVNDYVELVIWLMKKNGISSMPENKMLSLLVVNGLTYKMLPKDLYLSDKLIYKNEQFVLE